MTTLIDPITRRSDPLPLVRVEDATIGPVQGPRGFAWWRVDPDGRLETYPGVRWTPGWNEASCHLYPRLFRGRWHRLHPTGVPGPFCLCGFRGAYLPHPAGLGTRLSPRIHSGSGGMVFGVVEGAGAQVGNRREWRAAAAQPLALYAAAEHLRSAEATIGRVAARYGVPVLRDFDALTTIWGPADGEPVARPA